MKKSRIFLVFLYFRGEKKADIKLIIQFRRPFIQKISFSVILPHLFSLSRDSCIQMQFKMKKIEANDVMPWLTGIHWKSVLTV